MSDTIAQLSQFLQHADDKIVAQASDICKQLTSDAANCAQLLPLVPDLLPLTSSPTEDIAANAVIALINITSHIPAAIDRLISLNAITRLMDSVISHDPVLAHDKLMLLTNLTTAGAGCLQLLDIGDDQLRGQRLLRLAVRLTTPIDSYSIPQAQPLRGINVLAGPQDHFEYAAMVLMNATLLPEGRAVFFSTPDFFMPALLGAISSDNPIRKQGIIGVIRNLCFDHSKHEFLLTKVRILPYLIKALISRSIEKNESAVALLKAAFPGMPFGDPEPVAVNRHNILDAILLLSQSDVGRAVLVQHSVVLVMRELEEYETDEENKELGLRISSVLIGSRNEDPQ